MGMIGMALYGLGALIALVCAIRVLIAAFQESVGQGFLSLCVPFYIFYYVFGRWEHEQKTMWGIGLIVGVVLEIIGSAMTSM
ncbi:MAG: hypothetical protein JRI23_05345 [Deltaproteobacteria bacterium]|jgi:hypothetical protein|nr:hypothetical protein [Deltaproteobacteria bacterium]MBW2530977.1 hypothetical protein [Deltaproteobacteria bacterium]